MFPVPLPPDHAHAADLHVRYQYVIFVKMVPHNDVFFSTLWAFLTSILTEGLTDADRSQDRPLEELAKHWYKLVQNNKLVTACPAGQGSHIGLTSQNLNIFHLCIIEDWFKIYENLCRMKILHYTVLSGCIHVLHVHVHVCCTCLWHSGAILRVIYTKIPLHMDPFVQNN